MAPSRLELLFRTVTPFPHPGAKSGHNRGPLSRLVPQSHSRPMQCDRARQDEARPPRQVISARPPLFRDRRGTGFLCLQPAPRIHGSMCKRVAGCIAARSPDKQGIGSKGAKERRQLPTASRSPTPPLPNHLRPWSWGPLEPLEPLEPSLVCPTGLAGAPLASHAGNRQKGTPLARNRKHGRYLQPGGVVHVFPSAAAARWVNDVRRGWVLAGK